jgi:hypothetical protein
VSVGVATAITAQPGGLTVEQDKPFTLRVAATGSTLVYQWKKDGSPISGATLAEYTIPTAALSDAGSYVCVVEGGCGTVTSEAATVVVTPTTSVDEDRVSDVAWLRMIGPTPANEQVSIDLVGAGEEYELSILDLQGRTMSTIALGHVNEVRRVSIATDQLSAGMYLAQFRSGNRIGHVRITVGN